MKTIVLTKGLRGMCINSAMGLLLSKGIRPLAAFDEAHVVAVGEPLAYLPDNTVINEGLVDLIDKSLSISTILAVIKAVAGIRAFVYSSLLRDLGDYAAPPVVLGNGGIVDDVGLFGGGNYPMPIVANYGYEVSNNVKVIVLKFKDSIGTLRSELSRLFIGGYGGRVMVEADAHTVIKHKASFRRLAPALAGVVLPKIPDSCKVSIEESSTIVNVYRCRRCWIDYVGHGSMRRCPRCGNKVVELVKGQGLLRSMSIDGLSAKAKGVLNWSKMTSPLILPVSWFMSS